MNGDGEKEEVGTFLETKTCNYQPEQHPDEGPYIDHDTIPHLCHIELTYACNQNCLFCYNPEREPLGELQRVDRIVESVARSHIPHVYLIGGEPSLVSVERLNGYIGRLSGHSSVTIVTNGLKTLEGISRDLACFGVPIHGDEQTHEYLNQTPGSYQKTLTSIKHYVDQGHDVRCIPVLTGYNYDQMYQIIETAANLGMESVFVDRYEDGGIGASRSGERNLKPTRKQFEEAVSQIIQARKDFAQFEGKVGFGTAIPYCLDERIVEEGMTSNCGVGDYFCAVNPKGELRMCNQSQLVFGNVLEEPIEQIWNKPELDICRDLHWIEEPCKSCDLLLDCAAGCKVDANCSDSFCVDYAVRDTKGPSSELIDKVEHPKKADTYPTGYRRFEPNRYMKITTKYPENFLVTRYQTVKLNDTALRLAQEILWGQIEDEKDLIQGHQDRVSKGEIRLFVSRMIQVGALDLVGGADDEHN